MSAQSAMNGTAQTEPLRDGAGSPRTIPNSAGGESFAVDPLARLLRYLVLGSDGGTYYAGARAHTAANIDALLTLIAAGRGVEAVNLICAVSLAGRAPRQTPALTALAVCTVHGDAATQDAAHGALPDVARTPTMLFEYLDLRTTIARTGGGGGKGWGRAHRGAVQAWYLSGKRGALALAGAVTKYRKRNGYTHRDALRLCHAHTDDPARQFVLAYVARGIDAARRSGGPADVLAYLNAVEKARGLGRNDGDAMVSLIAEHRLVREHVPTALLSSSAVWAALLRDMPVTAMVRNLAKMTAVGLLTPGAAASATVCERLRDAERLRKARLHPLGVLMALRTYGSGRGDRGKLRWEPVPAVLDALEAAFEGSFAAVEPAGKRTLLALDVSGSMAAPCTGGSGGAAALTCAEAAAAMAVVTMRTEPACTAMCFSHDFVPLGMTKETDLRAAIALTKNRRFGGTDCSLPMQYALEQRLEVDTFVVYTDSETYYGKVHPCEALRKYRREMRRPDATLIVVGMASNGFSIADPEDPGMLDVVGFDSAASGLIADFAARRLA